MGINQELEMGELSDPISTACTPDIRKALFPILSTRPILAARLKSEFESLKLHQPIRVMDPWKSHTLPKGAHMEHREHGTTLETAAEEKEEKGEGKNRR